MNSEHLQSLFAAAVRELKSHRDELCRIDAETGDGDHGFAIVQIAETILCESLKPAREDTQVYFDDLCLALLRLNSGSAGNLWGVMMEGIGAALAPSSTMEAVRQMLRGALAGLAEISPARPGEKTLADPLSAALAAAEAQEDIASCLQAVSKAALEAAAATAQMPARYGRAKNLPDKGIGHRDPGAVSLAIMIDILCKAELERLEPWKNSLTTPPS